MSFYSNFCQWENNYYTSCDTSPYDPPQGPRTLGNRQTADLLFKWWAPELLIKLYNTIKNGVNTVNSK